MKIKLPGNKWEKIGELVGILCFALNEEHGEGMMITTSKGVEIFYDKEDMMKLSGLGKSSSDFRF